MANGGSRIGGFLRGVLTGLVVCAIAVLVLSLAAPVPERDALDIEAEVPVGTASDGTATEPTAGPEATAPQAATAPAADPAPATPESGASPEAEVIVVPVEEPADAGDPAAPAGEDVAPQATWPEAAPGAGEAEPPAGSGAFSAPQSPTQ